MAVTAQQVLSLTSGLFKAVPSKAILTDLVKFNGNIDQLAATLGTSEFAINAFPFSNAEKAKLLAENLLGSTVADKAAAITALKGVLNANGGNVGAAAQLAITVINSDAAYADAKAQLENRVKVAEAYVDSNKGNEISTSVLDSVTNDAATVTTAIESLTGNTGGNEAGVSRVLTTGQDVFTGTSGNDNFRAVAGVQQGSQDQTTLNSADNIDGATGDDTLIVNMTGTNYAGGARIKNIETLQIGTNLNAAVTFDYNINQGQNEITDVTKVVYDQINQGENLRVSNLLKTGDALPTLAWTNEANSIAGTIQADFRTSAVQGETALTVELNNVLALNDNAATGVLNIGAGVETLNLVSGGTSGRNTLNASNRTDGGAVDIVSAGSTTTTTEGVNDDGSLKKVIVTGSQALGKLATVVTDTTNANFGLVNRTAGGADDLGRDTTSTAANLISLAATVTELDASAATGDTNIRFTSRVDAAEVNVTYKGGKGNDYVEFQQGNINANGGDGNDTFAFINAQNNSTLTTADTIVGGAGTDTIQVGVNGAGSYNLDTTEFNNKSGIDVLDLRGATNTVRLADAFVAAADAGLVVRTDKIVQTSDTNTANSSTATTNNALENNSTNTITLTALAANRAIEFIGGSGSDRIVVNETSLNSNVKLDGGTNLSTTGRFDTITVQDSAVLSRGDLAQVKNFEGIVLVKSDATSARQYTIEVTEAFLNNNSTQNKTLQIGTIAAANQNALTAGDTVTIDVSDLLTTANAFKTTGYDRKIDTTSLTAAGVTVNYVANGGAVTAATLQALGLVNSTADASQALVLNSAATAVSNAGAGAAAPVALTATSNVTGTATNDLYQGTVAAIAGATVNGGNGTDTLQVTDAGNLGTISANITNVEVLTLANGTNTVTLNNGGVFATVTGGTGADTVTLAANASSDAASVNLGDGNDSLTFLGRTYTGSFVGGNGVDTLVTANNMDLRSATVTGFETLTIIINNTITVGANSLLSQFANINASATNSSETINIVSGSHDLSGTTVGGFLTEVGQTTTYAVSAGATLTVGGDAQIGADAVAVFTGAGTLATNAALNLSGATDTISNVTFTAGGYTITDGTAVARTYTMGTGVNTLALDTVGNVNNTVTINGFTVGAAGDVLDLNNNGIGGNEVAFTATGGNISAGDTIAVGNIANLYLLNFAGARVAAGQLAATGNGAAVETAVLAAGLVTGAAATGNVYVGLTDGTNTGVYRLSYTESADADATLNLASEFTVTLVAQINNVSDLGSFNGANFI